MRNFFSAGRKPSGKTAVQQARRFLRREIAETLHKEYPADNTIFDLDYIADMLNTAADMSDAEVLKEMERRGLRWTGVDWMMTTEKH